MLIETKFVSSVTAPQNAQQFKKPVGLTRQMFRRALIDAFTKLHPRLMVRNRGIRLFESSQTHLDLYGYQSLEVVSQIARSQ